MTYSITAINAVTQNAHTTSSCYTLGSMSMSPAFQHEVEVQITIRLHEYNHDDISTIENFEKALQGEELLDGAPSYKELLKEYHPEFLL